MQSKWCTEGEMSRPSVLHTLLRAWHQHSPHCNLISTSLVPGFRRITLARDKSSVELPAWIVDVTRVAGVWGALSSLQSSSFKSNLNSNFKSNVEVTSECPCDFNLSPIEISLSAICKMWLFSNSAHESEDFYPQHILPSWSSLLSVLGLHIRQGQRGWGGGGWGAVRDADKLSDSLCKKERAL